MKSFASITVLAAALLAAGTLAEPEHGFDFKHKPHKPAPHGGYHGGYHDHPAYYQYGYKVYDEYHKTNFGHDEKRDGKHTSGSYFVHLPDGRVQTVHYTVDGYNGYVADVKYEGKAHYAPHQPHYKPVHKPHKPVHGYGH